MKLIKYRIQADNYKGYECRVWRFWFPIWMQLGGINTHSKEEEARKYIKRFKNKIYID